MTSAAAEGSPRQRAARGWPALSKRFLADYRVPICATLMIVALVAAFSLPSQSAASFTTYLLAAYVLLGAARWRGLFLDWGFLAVVALLIYIPLTSAWSAPFDARGALSQAIRAVLVFAFVVSFAECMQVDWFRRRMTLAVATAAALAALAALCVFFIAPPLDARLNGLGQLDTHVMAGMVYAMAFLCGVSWLLDAWRDARPIVRWATVAGIAVLMLAVCLTASRTAMAGGAFALACLLLAHRAPTAGRFLAHAALVAACLVAAVLAVYVAVPGGDAMVLPRGDSFRLDIWSRYVAQIAADGPWFGLGVLTDDATEVPGSPVLHPHNLYLSVARQGGLLGLGLMLLVVASTLNALLRHHARPEAKLGLAICALALPGYLLDGYELVDKIGWTWLLFWLPVAIGIALRCRPALDDAARFGAGMADNDHMVLR